MKINKFKKNIQHTICFKIFNFKWKITYKYLIFSLCLPNSTRRALLAGSPPKRVPQNRDIHPVAAQWHSWRLGKNNFSALNPAPRRIYLRSVGTFSGHKSKKKNRWWLGFFLGARGLFHQRFSLCFVLLSTIKMEFFKEWWQFFGVLAVWLPDGILWLMTGNGFIYFYFNKII